MDIRTTTTETLPNGLRMHHTRTMPNANRIDPRKLTLLELQAVTGIAAFLLAESAELVRMIEAREPWADLLEWINARY